MRLFIAVELPEGTRRRIEELAQGLRARLPTSGRAMRWVKSDQFHITLKFLGECPDLALSRLKTAMDYAANLCTPFQILFQDVGSFKSGDSFRVLWLGITDGKDSLKALADALNTSCASAGFPEDRRPFHSHLTLARSKEPWPKRVLDSALRDASASGIGPVPVQKLSLIQSVLSPQGPNYTTLYEVNLNSQKTVIF